MKEKIWKKWRGKNKTIERRNKIPDEEDKLTKKLQEIERKVEEYKKSKAEKIETRDRKKKEWKERNKMIVEDTWGMFRWLTQYIDENQHDWIRRKELEEKEMEEEYVRWSGMDENEMIEILQKEEEKERNVVESKKERAERRKSYWKEYREESTDIDRESNQEIRERKEETDNEKGKGEEELKERKKFVIEMKERRMKWEEVKRGREKLAEGPEYRPEKFSQNSQWMEVDLFGRESRKEGMCMICVSVPCLCELLTLEKRLEELQGAKENCHRAENCRGELGGYQGGLLEGQGTSMGTLTPPEPAPWEYLEGKGLENEALTPQEAVGEGGGEEGYGGGEGEAGQQVLEETGNQVPRLNCRNLAPRRNCKTSQQVPRENCREGQAGGENCREGDSSGREAGNQVPTVDRKVKKGEKGKKIARKKLDTGQQVPRKAGNQAPWENCQGEEDQEEAKAKSPVEHQPQAEAEGELPEGDNYSPQPISTPAKLGGEGVGGEEADYETYPGSSAFLSDGPQAVPGEEAGGEAGGAGGDQNQRSGGEDCQGGLLEGQGTYKGTLTPPEPAPGVHLEGKGLEKEALTPQEAGGWEGGGERGCETPKTKTLLDRMREKAKVMEEKNKELEEMNKVKKKTPARKRKIEVEEDEDPRRRIEQDRMKRMLERWKKKEHVNDVDSDKTVTNLTVTVVDDVVDQNTTRKKNKVEKSTVQRGLDRFSMKSGDGEDSFKVWKEQRKRRTEQNRAKEKDRSGPPIIDNNCFGRSMGEGEGAADDRGDQAIVGGAASSINSLVNNLPHSSEEKCVGILAPVAADGKPVLQ